jgi:hypothetical protein
MIIVNFATKEFSRGQDRLKRSLEGHHSLMFNDYNQINSPTHRESPYEFKVHAIETAFEFDDIVLWCDSSLFRVGDLDKIKKVIWANGYFMEEAGHYVKDWCNQHTRQYFKLKPEESGMTMFSAGLLGLDKTSPIAMEFFNQWKASALAGCFKGSWNDHRHDMTCGSIIAQRLGMTYQRGGSHMAYLGDGYQKPDPGVVFHLQGI